MLTQTKYQPKSIFLKGNVISDNQFSFYIRSYKETECNGFSFPMGHLRDSDLNHWKELPRNVERKIKELTNNLTVVLYEFRHWSDDKKIVDGYTIIEPTTNQVLATFYTGETIDSIDAVDEAIRILLQS